MTLSKPMWMLKHLSVLLLLALFLSSSVSSATVRKCDGPIKCVTPPGGLGGGQIILQVVDTITTPVLTQVISILSQNVTMDDPVLGQFDLIYDTSNPAPASELTAINAGEFYPAVATYRFNWIMVFDSLPGETLRTISPVIIVSDTLSDWPIPNMRHVAITNAYFEDINNPGDTVLEYDLIGTEVTVSPAVIPTLTEWGMIIFCALLFAWMAWVLVRRRKRITIGM